MDRRTFMAAVAALIVIVVFALQGWWLFLAVLCLASLACGFMGSRAGLPWFKTRDD
jgi:hypothetical protein